MRTDPGRGDTSNFPHEEHIREGVKQKEMQVQNHEIRMSLWGYSNNTIARTWTQPKQA